MYVPIVLMVKNQLRQLIVVRNVPQGKKVKRIIFFLKRLHDTPINIKIL